MGCLDDGVDALLRFQPGMGGAPGDVDAVHADTLAPDLQRPAVCRRFEDEHPAARRGPLLDELPRRQRADFFIARHQQLDAAAVGECRHGVDRRNEAALHVEHPGPGRPPAAHCERARRQRPEREHRVVMSEDQHPRRSAPAPMHVRSGVTVDELRVGPEPRPKQLGEHVRRPGQTFEVV